MKKIIPGLTLISLLALVAVPILVNGQTTTVGMIEQCTIRSARTASVGECGGLVVGSPARYDEKAICCMMDKLYMITDWIFVLLMALAVIFVLYGGFLIIAAGGSEERVLKGRTFIMWALVGFAVAILARALPLIAYYLVK